MSKLRTDNIESLDTGRVVEVDSIVDTQDLANDASGSGASLVSMEGGPSVEVAVLDRVIRVTSIADMEAYSVPVGSVFSLNAGGRSGDFDVVAGDFSAELAADPLGAVYVQLSNGLTAKRRFFGKMNIKWFGALGDAFTDDTSAFSAALDLTALDEVVALYFPSGRYLISGNYTIQDQNIEFEGDGQSSYIAYTGTGVFIEVLDVSIRYSKEISGIKNLSFVQQDLSRTTTCFKLEGTWFLRVQACHFSYFDIAVEEATTLENSYEHCAFVGNNTCIKGGYGLYANNTHVTECYFQNNRSWIFDLGSVAPHETQGYLKVSNSTIEGNYGGILKVTCIYSASRDTVIFNDCWFELNGIDLNPGEPLIIDVNKNRSIVFNGGKPFYTRTSGLSASFGNVTFSGVRAAASDENVDNDVDIDAVEMLISKCSLLGGNLRYSSEQVQTLVLSDIKETSTNLNYLSRDTKTSFIPIHLNTPEIIKTNYEDLDLLPDLSAGSNASATKNSTITAFSGDSLELGLPTNSGYNGNNAVVLAILPPDSNPGARPNKAVGCFLVRTVSGTGACAVRGIGSGVVGATTFNVDEEWRQVYFSIIQTNYAGSKTIIVYAEGSAVDICIQGLFIYEHFSSLLPLLSQIR